jgi:hypothetical protein
VECRPSLFSERSQFGLRAGGLFVIVDWSKVAMDHNSDLPGELFEVGIAAFVIAILFGLAELFFHYV